MARFYFKTQFGAATIRGWLDFEGGVYRDQHARAQTDSIISLFVCMYKVRAHTYIAVDPLPFSEISRAVFIGKSLQKHVATFQGRRDFEVRRDFEEIQYINLSSLGK